VGGGAERASELSDADFETAVTHLSDLTDQAPPRSDESENYATSLSVPSRRLNYREQMWALPIEREMRHQLGLDEYPPKWLSHDHGKAPTEL
jgi:hypothetical protein